MNIFFPLSLIMVFFSMSTLFYFKHEVLNLDKDIAKFSRSLAQTEEQLALLKTEWSYLTHPKRIAELAHKHYADIEPVNKNQIIECGPLGHDIQEEQSLTASNRRP